MRMSNSEPWCSIVASAAVVAIVATAVLAPVVIFSCCCYLFLLLLLLLLGVDRYLLSGLGHFMASLILDACYHIKELNRHGIKKL